MKRITEMHINKEAPYGGLTGLAFGVLLSTIDGVKKKIPSPKVHEISTLPMLVRWCKRHGKEINRDYYTYEVWRCPACMQDSILKAYKAGYKAAIRASRASKGRGGK